MPLHLPSLRFTAKVRFLIILWMTVRPLRFQRYLPSRPEVARPVKADSRKNRDGPVSCLFDRVLRTICRQPVSNPESHIKRSSPGKRGNRRRGVLGLSGKTTRRELRVYAVQNGRTSIQHGSVAVEVISPGSRNFRRNSPAQWFHCILASDHPPASTSLGMCLVVR